MELAVILSSLTLCFTLFYWKTVKLYFYTINCFNNICEMKYIQEKYTLSVNGKRINNLRISTFGTMYIAVVIPEEVESQYFDEYLQTYLTLLEQAMVVQNLYGLVKTKKEKFLIKSDEGVTNAIFYIKFVPILYKNTFLRFTIYTLTSLIAVYLVNHFNIATLITNLFDLIANL